MGLHIIFVGLPNGGTLDAVHICWFFHTSFAVPYIPLQRDPDRRCDNFNAIYSLALAECPCE